MINTLLWTGIGFLLGAMPFSFWLGHLLRQTDVREYGDGNPGATNAWKAGGWRVGIPALLLDYIKGAIPVGLAHFVFGISGWGLVPVALAPALGHAYSPFLGFCGGKALAVTFGLWTGLMLAEGPIVLGLFLALFLAIQTRDGWAVILGILAFLGYMVLRRLDSFIMVIWAGNTLLLAWKYRADLQQGPQPRPWIFHLLRHKIG
jgi:glycerol-3-phosphate acyltransferase PlsY